MAITKSFLVLGASFLVAFMSGAQGQTEQCFGLDVEGTPDGIACCLLECAQCGGPGCGIREIDSVFTASEACCAGGVRGLERPCSDHEPPCTVSDDTGGGSGTTSYGDDATDGGSGSSKTDDGNADDSSTYTTEILTLSSDTTDDDATDADDSSTFTTEMPSSDTTDDDGTDGCTGLPQFLMDGLCDKENNNQACDFDGGDCCEETCMDGPNHSCGDIEDGIGGFECLDPEVGTPPPSGACSNGIESEDKSVCCSSKCNACGGSNCKLNYAFDDDENSNDLKIGRANCCQGTIEISGVFCGEVGGDPPCII